MLHSQGDTFEITVSPDDTHFPQFFCNRCYSVTRRQAKAAEEGLPFRHATIVFKDWMRHREESCTVSK